MPKDIYIIDAVRTPVGSPYRSFKTLDAKTLAATVIRALIRRNKTGKKSVDEIVLGNVVAAGLGQNIARQAAIAAGLPVHVNAYTVNNVCGAGLLSVSLAMRGLSSGVSTLSIAGGVESATRAPYLVEREDADRHKVRKMVDSILHDGLSCQITGKRMGELIERLALKHRITRQQQDRYALASHQKACRAQAAGVFSREIIPVAVPKKKKVVKDDRPRENVNISNFKLLKPAFKRRGRVTSGNTATPGDGAAAVLLAAGNTFNKRKAKPLAKVLACSSVGVEPRLSFEAEVPAVRQALKHSGLSLKDIDLFEISEAFAAQSLFVQKKLNIPDEKMNVFGGDMALGHPLGAAGTRLLVTLTHALHAQKAKRGLACIPFGGGGAAAIVIERV